MRVDSGRAAGVALISIIGGIFVGAALFAFAGGELAKLDGARPEDSAGFFKGMMFGAVFGGVSGYSFYRSWRKRAEAPPETADLTPAEAAASFSTRMRVRSASLVAATAGFAGYYLFRDRGPGASFWFMPLCFLGMLGFFFASRCPSCGAFLNGREVRKKHCERCGMSFTEG